MSRQPGKSEDRRERNPFNSPEPPPASASRPAAPSPTGTTTNGTTTNGTTVPFTPGVPPARAIIQELLKTTSRRLKTYLEPPGHAMQPRPGPAKSSEMPLTTATGRRRMPA